jgi:hypothetical protein
MTLVGNMGSDPGDELQIIHRLLGGAVLAGAIADLALGPQKGQPLQRQKRPDHVFPDPFGLRLGLRPHAAMDRERRMSPGKNPFRPLRAEEFLADEKSQDIDHSFDFFKKKIFADEDGSDFLVGEVRSDGCAQTVIGQSPDFFDKGAGELPEEKGIR